MHIDCGWFRWHRIKLWSVLGLKRGGQWYQYGRMSLVLCCQETTVSSMCWRTNTTSLLDIPKEIIWIHRQACQWAHIQVKLHQKYYSSLSKGFDNCVERLACKLHDTSWLGCYLDCRSFLCSYFSYYWTLAVTIRSHSSLHQLLSEPVTYPAFLGWNGSCCMLTFFDEHDTFCI